MKVRWPMLIVGVMLIAGLVLILGNGFGKDVKYLSDNLTGRPYRPFKTVDFEGNEVSLEEVLASGKPVVLNFWSTWCGPCKQEHPWLQQAAETYPDVQFYGVLYQDDVEAAKRFLKRQGSAYSTLEDTTGAIAITYGVGGVPETFFIDRAGTIIHKENGPLFPPTLMPLLETLRASNP
jgi:cytochrome c biogenesis protein CcmG, thiol:disulfide interchange protein DsbE